MGVGVRLTIITSGHGHLGRAGASPIVDSENPVTRRSRRQSGGPARLQALDRRLRHRLLVTRVREATAGRRTEEPRLRHGASGSVPLLRPPKEHTHVGQVRLHIHACPQRFNIAGIRTNLAPKLEPQPAINRASRRSAGTACQSSRNPRACASPDPGGFGSPVPASAPPAVRSYRDPSAPLRFLH